MEHQKLINIYQENNQLKFDNNTNKKINNDEESISDLKLNIQRKISIANTNFSSQQEKILKSIESTSEKIALDPENFQLHCMYISLLKKALELLDNNDKDSIKQYYSRLEEARRRVLYLYPLTDDMILEWIKDIYREYNIINNISNSNKANYINNTRLLSNKEFLIRIFFVFENTILDFQYVKVLKKYLSFLSDLISNDSELLFSLINWKVVLDSLEVLFRILICDVKEKSYVYFIENYFNLLETILKYNENKRLSHIINKTNENINDNSRVSFYFVNEEYIREKYREALKLPRKRYLDLTQRYCLFENMLNKKKAINGNRVTNTTNYDADEANDTDSNSLIEISLKELSTLHHINILTELDNDLKTKEVMNFINELNTIISKSSNNHDSEENNNNTLNNKSNYDSAPIIRFLNKRLNKNKQVSSFYFFYYSEICLTYYYKDVDFWIYYLNQTKTNKIMQTLNDNNQQSNFLLKQHKRSVKFCYDNAKIWTLYLREIEGNFRENNNNDLKGDGNGNLLFINENSENTMFNEIIFKTEEALKSNSTLEFQFLIIKFKIEFLSRYYKYLNFNDNINSENINNNINHNSKFKYIQYYRNFYISTLNYFITIITKTESDDETTNTIVEIIIKLSTIILDFECYYLNDYDQLKMIFLLLRNSTIFDYYSNSKNFVTSYISLIKHSCNFDLIRKEFKSIINEFNNDYSDEVYHTWILWEKTFGDYGSINSALEYKESIKNSNANSDSFIAHKKIKFESEDKNSLSNNKCAKKDFEKEAHSVVNNLNNITTMTNITESSDINVEGSSYITPKGNKTKSRLIANNNFKINNTCSENKDNKDDFYTSSKFEIADKVSLKGIGNLVFNSNEKKDKKYLNRNESDEYRINNVDDKVDSNTNLKLNEFDNINNSDNTNTISDINDKEHSNYDNKELIIKDETSEHEDKKDKITLIFKNLHPTLSSIDLENIINKEISIFNHNLKDNDYKNSSLDEKTQIIIKDIRIVLNKEGKSRGYAFVDVNDVISANALVKIFNQLSIDNPNKLKCAISHSYEEDDNRTIFINNLNFQTTEHEIIEAFSKYGNILDVRLKKQDTNPYLLKGYGFIEYTSEEEVSKLLRENPIIEIRNRKIIVKPSKTNTKVKQGIKHTAFISNLKYEVIEKDLEEFFISNKLERIVDCRILKTVDGKSKGVAIIEFSNEDELIKAVKLSGTAFKERAINIKRTYNNNVSENSGNRNSINYNKSSSESNSNIDCFLKRKNKFGVGYKKNTSSHCDQDIKTDENSKSLNFSKELISNEKSISDKKIGKLENSDFKKMLFK